MYKTLLAAAILSLMLTAPLRADDTGKTAKPATKSKCRVAEVHPITGHLECVDPPGAPIEQPKERVLPPCPPEKKAASKDKKKKEWVVQTNCIKPDDKSANSNDSEQPKKHKDSPGGH